jgi:putative hemolysin
VVDYLRFRTYLLRRERKPRFHFKPRENRRRMDPIANSRGKHILASEVASLPDANILLRNNEFTVFHASADMIPRLLREIGIRREETFRRVGEGTGRPMDIDRFDDTYRHLVLWSHKEREVAGAYRFALTDEIMASQGVDGLYTSTLFNYRPGFPDGLGPALELGRSFVVPAYQRSYQPLLMLWKGLAEYVVRNPRYSRLFGCVSVSSEYSVVARELIVGFMERHCSLPEMADMALPKRPPKVKRLKRLDFSMPDGVFDDPEDVADFVRDVEDGRSIPVLLKQYLKLGGKIIGFNMDPDFGNCMDGLILVDLLKSDPKVLSRFMGRDGVKRFHAANRAASVRPVRVGGAAA